MADEQVALLLFITIAWAFSRQTILKYKPIPKWLDISIVVVCVIVMSISFCTFKKGVTVFS